MFYLPKIVDSQFLVRVIKNEVSPDEKEYFETWLQESEKHKEEFRVFLLLWDKTGQIKLPAEPDCHKQFMELLEKLEINFSGAEFIEETKTRGSLNHNKQVPQNLLKHRWLGLMQERILGKEKIIIWQIRIAALLTIICLIFQILYRGSTNILPVISPEIVQVETVQQRSAPKGEKISVSFPNGTIVRLNCNSTINIPRNNIDSTMHTELSGEGFFSIPSNSGLCSIKAGPLIIESRKSEFNVKCRKEKIIAVVNNGEIKVSSTVNNSSLILKKGEIVTFSKEKGLSAPVKINIYPYICWRENKLSFIHAKLTEVMQEIENFYNLPVYYEKQNNNTAEISGIFAAGKIDKLLRKISEILHADISRQGSKIIVR